MRMTFTEGSLRRRIGIAAVAVAAVGAVAVPGVAWASNGISNGGPVSVEQGVSEQAGKAPECAKVGVPATASTEAIHVSEEEAQKLLAEDSAAAAAGGVAATASVPAQTADSPAQTDQQETAVAASC